MHRKGLMKLLLATLLLFAALPAESQVISLEERPWTGELLRPSGQPVIPIFEGWYANPDGSRSLCFGFFNLNTVEASQVPLGPANFLEPLEFDGMQPTHFDPVPEAGYRRRWCVFTVEVPAEFAGEDRVVWTLRSGGETLSVPGHVMPAFILDEIRADGRGDVAPVLRLDAGGPTVQGRTGIVAAPRRISVGEPLELTVDVEHPGPRSWIGWTKHQGPDEVAFAEAELQLEPGAGTATTTARFAAPGEYLLRVQVIDAVSSFEFHCCWTNAYVPVTVTP